LTFLVGQQEGNLACKKTAASAILKKGKFLETRPNGKIKSGRISLIVIE